MSKILVFDLDQTLLHTNKTISDYSEKVIRKCGENNKIVIATGRSIVRSREYAKQIGADAIIALNGSITYIDDHVVSNIPVNEQCVRDMFNVILKIPNVVISVFYPTRILTNSEEFVRNGDCIFSSFDNIEYHEIQKIFIITDDNEYLESIDFRLWECNIYKDTHMSNCYVISHINVNKMHAIESLCNIYKIDIQNAICFGDDHNDKEMILGCGIGVVVSNGVESIKQISDSVCDSNDNDGPAKWLDKNMLIT